nr:Rid family hydrolase [Acidisoma sp. S159]
MGGVALRCAPGVATDRPAPRHRSPHLQTVLEAAQSDPAGFIRGLDRAIIDEIQRAPGLLLAIEKTVDEDYRPGRFLLTGSANVLTLPRVAYSLAGRMKTIQILPLARPEVEGRTPTFLEHLFEGKLRSRRDAILGDDLVRIVSDVPQIAREGRCEIGSRPVLPPALVVAADRFRETAEQDIAPKATSKVALEVIKFIEPDGLMLNSTFSQVAIATGSSVIYTSGQVAVDVYGHLVGAGDLAAQTRQAMRNLSLALAAAGADFSDVVKTTTFVVGFEPQHREIITGAKEPFYNGRKPPTSALIGVSSLAMAAWLIEIEAVAVLE